MNKVFIMGRLTKDPEQRMTPSGIEISKITIADNRPKRSGEEQQTDFFNCVAFRKTAEILNKFFTKGQMILVVGTMQTRTWDGQDGQKRYATEIIIEEVKFVGSQNKSDQPEQKDSPNEELSHNGFLDDVETPF